MSSMRKLTTAGLLVALGVVMSAFSIPVGISRCFPAQHFVNVVAGIFLGPSYGVTMAFSTSLIRNMMGTGSLLAFPGSMVGALVCGLAFRYTHKLWAACLGELVGTGILGGMLCWPVAVYLMGRQAALFAYVIPFLISSLGGVLIAAILLGALKRTGLLEHMLDTPSDKRSII